MSANDKQKSAAPDPTEPPFEKVRTKVTVTPKKTSSAGNTRSRDAINTQNAENRRDADSKQTALDGEVKKAVSRTEGKPRVDVEREVKRAVDQAADVSHPNKIEKIEVTTEGEEDGQKVSTTREAKPKGNG